MWWGGLSGIGQSSRSNLKRFMSHGLGMYRQPCPRAVSIAPEIAGSRPAVAKSLGRHTLPSLHILCILHSI